MRLPTALLLIAIVTVVGCKPTRSKVRWIEPPDGVELVDPPREIRVAFDRGMKAASIDSDTFVVRGTIIERYEGTLSYDPASTTAVFVPTTPFPEGEIVEVSLTSGIESASSKKLDPFRSTFSIRGPEIIEPDAFRIETTDPTSASHKAPRFGSLHVGFSSPCDPFAVTATTFRVVGERSGRRQLTFDGLFDGGNDVSVAVDRAFLAGERVSLIVDEALHSAQGAALENPRTLEFVVSHRGSTESLTPVAEGSTPSGSRIAFLDANGDGHEEWVVAQPAGQIDLFDESGIVDGWTLTHGIAELATGDFDGDGNTDLLCLGTAGDRLTLLLGDGSELDVASVFTWTGFVATTVAARQLDPDGFCDLLLGSGSSLRVRWGAGTSPLNRSDALTLPAAAGLDAADLDDDGAIDLAFLDEAGLPRVAWGTGAGTWDLAEPVSNLPVTHLWLANTDGDGRFDLVTWDAVKDTTEVFLSLENRGFGSAGRQVGVLDATALIVDWDGDGTPDVVAAHRVADSLSIAPGLGDGTFSAPLLGELLGDASDLALGDTDGDGVLELGAVHDRGRWSVLIAQPISPVPVDRIFIPDFSVSPGSFNRQFTISADHESPIEAFTIALNFDPDAFDLESLTTIGTDAGAHGVELELPQINPETGEAVIAVIFDFVPPFDQGPLPGGFDQSLAIGTLDVAATLSGSTALLELADGVGSPPSDTLFVVSGISVAPELDNPVVSVVGGGGGSVPASNAFLRGDANRDGAIDLSDGTFIQAYLFSGGPTPACYDAADVNDDGTVDMTDAVVLFEYVVGDGPAPSAPFPAVGMDPTNDALSCES